MKSLRAKIAENHKETGVRSVCSYGLRWEKGERLQINDACYYRAKWDVYQDVENGEPLRRGKVIELAASMENAKVYAKSYKISNTHLRQWVSYILQRSPFKDCFKTKNLQAAWRYGIQMDVKKPVGQVVASLIALREGWEFRDIAYVFNLLTKNGINEDVAFLLSRMASVRNGNFYSSGFGGHQSIGSGRIHHLKAFLKKGLASVDKPLEDNPASYKIFETTRTEGYWNEHGKCVDTILFKGAKKERWESKYLSKTQFIANAKEVEKELLE